MGSSHRYNVDDVFAESDDDDAEFRSSTWNFIENSSSSRDVKSESYMRSTPIRTPTAFNSRIGGKGSANGVETRTTFTELPST
ncbi:hypothetical protein CAEBREN_30903 [Caenorhabditis brenneri]|uniref:Uncharacterized protein n=1 Tax=Caenorhabditis brenneri TaxID=135651 RepID=G0NIF3_CAEBE|nr:hypothetical protein CAEBREN_30903 [Caenorhabditis brenneri]